MQGIFLISIFAVLFSIGLARPFVLALGYVWVDLFTPQAVNPDMLGSIPVSLIMGAGAFFAYFLFGERHRPRLSATAFLLMAFGAWTTLTLMWAELPEYAWVKWDWSVKTVLFTAFLPSFFRSRAQIEAFVLTIVFSVSGILVPVGIKTMLTGGGYGFDLTPIFSPGPVLGESVTLSLCAVMTIPLVIFMSRHSILLPWFRARTAGSAGLIICYVAAALGTFARTGLVSLLTLGMLLFWQSKRRLLVGTTMFLIASCILPVLGPAWIGRMETIGSSEASAEGRLHAWIWALQYVAEHPLGGGLDAYRINAPAMRVISEGVVTTAKATHSIYFEVLSETGVIGFLIWGTIILIFFRNMYRLWRKTQGLQEFDWLCYLTKACATSMIIFIVGGSFLSIAFIPIFYYLLVIGCCLYECYRTSATNRDAEKRFRLQFAAVPRNPAGHRTHPGSVLRRSSLVLSNPPIHP